tara:strand:- start:196 stop:1806 length:1611 start_codon:yes stop_codon:yes gene_type:complete
MSTDWDLLIENHFDRKSNNKLTLETLNESIGEVLQEMENARSFLISENKTGGRFSMSIPIPRLVPTEAWGDPDSISREDIKEVFNVFRRAGGIRERIEYINSFLSPEAARRKAPGGKVNTLLRMMQVIEALQAAINDYSESSAGFVFEGFMAALTGGRQEAGRVGGTLPIEDFITNKGENVSLKLLSPGTGVHGSFTNLVDYLFLRGDAGEPSIQYLVAAKNSEGDTVTNLLISEFEISRDSFVDIMVSTKNGKHLGEMAQPMKTHIANWQNSPEWRLRMAEILKQTPGYDIRRGMFVKSLGADGDRFETEVEPGKEKEVKKQAQYDRNVARNQLTDLKQNTRAAGAAHARGDGPDFEEWYSQTIDDDMMLRVGLKNKRGANYDKYITMFRDQFEIGEKAGSQLSESFFGAFHEDEKRYMQEDLMFEGKAGKGDGGAQWTISQAAMQGQESILNTVNYGEVDLSQKNIDQLAEIYTEKLGEDVMAILNATKDFTENVGTYFTTEDRSKAKAANTKAQEDALGVADKLAAQAADKES